MNFKVWCGFWCGKWCGHCNTVTYPTPMMETHFRGISKSADLKPLHVVGWLDTWGARWRRVFLSMTIKYFWSYPRY